MANAKLPKT
jgi:hypothetical protein